MATRSFIGKRLLDGSVQGAYCHWDGYPEGVGATLKEHYTDPAKVDALLALGDISALGEEIGERQDFDHPNPLWTVAYHRDRGEELEPNTVYATVRDMLRDASDDFGAEHAYVFESGAWTHHKL